MFFFILDSAAYNAFVLFKSSGGYLNASNWRRQRRDSLEKLAISLFLPFVEERNRELARKNYKHIHTDVLRSIKHVGVKLIDKNIPELETENERGQCQICVKNKVISGRCYIKCRVCEEFTCKSHRFDVCYECF